MIAGVDIGTIPALSAAHASEAKRMAERVYPTLYIFENSVRDLIEVVLKAAYGKDWWSHAVPGAVQATAEKFKGGRGERRVAQPSRQASDRLRAPERPLGDHQHRWADFKPLFPTQAWVETLITNDMNVSRRPLAHMNPLAADDIANIEAAFRKWTRQLQGVEDQLP